MVAEPKEKLSKIERIKKSIDDVDSKIAKLTARKEELKKDLEEVQKTEILSILSSKFKTAEEISDFITAYRSGGYSLDLVKHQDNDERTEGNNDLSDQTI